MGYLNSGNSIVDAMGSINISGNIIPAIWYKTITKENGKPYLLAIAILSDIVYWYRPTEVRDPQTGHITSWKKKFSDDLLRQSYQYYADLFGESKKTVKVAMDRLEALNVIRREFRTIICGDGIVCNNVMYIALNPDVLYCLTFPEKITGIDENEDCYLYMPEWKEDSFSEKSDSSMEHPEGSFPTKRDTPMEKLGGSLPQKWDTPMEKLGGSLPPKWDRPIEKSGGSPPQKWDRPIDKAGDRYFPNRLQVHTKKDTGLSENGGTNTHTSAKISNRDSHPIHPSNKKSKKATDEMEDFNQYVEIIKKNIEYEFYMNTCGDRDRQLYHELFSLICEVVGVKRKMIRIAGEDYPYELVKTRFLELDSSHLLYVIECINNTTTSIGNIKSYMLTSLFNAPSTINHFYQQKVVHDRYAEG